MSMTARRVTVHGTVQGVFFRDTCRREAAARGVAGWVTNNSDGTVIVHVEGASGAVDEMVAWCRHGPARAAVAGLDVEDVEAAGLTSFEVR